MPSDKKRTSALHIYTPAGGDYRIEAVRETIRTYENKDSMPVPGSERRVRRQLSQIAKAELPCGPIMVETYDDLRAVISACADALADEDEVTEAAARKETLKRKLP